MELVRTVEIDGGSTGTVRLGLGLVVVVVVGDEVVLVARAGTGDIHLVLLARLPDLGEVQGVVRQPVLLVPVPERRHRHPPFPLLHPSKKKKVLVEKLLHSNL